MEYSQKKFHHADQRGSVLVMSIIIASSIVIIGVEFALFVVNSIRQARNLDSTITAFYAAESGVESLMHQVRNGGLISDMEANNHPYCDLPTRRSGEVQDTDSKWTVLTDGDSDSDANTLCGLSGPLDKERFNTKLSSLDKSLILHDDSVEFLLYENDFKRVTDLSKLNIEWMAAEQCSTPGEQPWIETRVVFWNEGSLKWDENIAIKKEFQTPETGKKNVSVDLAALDGSSDGKVSHPMLVRLKLFYCDLRGVKIQLFNSATVPGPIPIPNYFTIHPIGTYRGVNYRDISVTLPKKGAHSSIFDYTLFSEEKVEKNDPLID